MREEFRELKSAEAEQAERAEKVESRTQRDHFEMQPCDSRWKDTYKCRDVKLMA